MESDGAEPRRPQEFGCWREVFSSSGKIYYYNSETEVSQWEKPQEWKEHDAQEVQRLAAIEAERQRQQNAPPPAQFPFPFPNLPVMTNLPSGLAPPPNFSYGMNSGLPFQMAGTPSGFPPGPPPPMPPPRMPVSSQSQPRSSLGRTPETSQNVSPIVSCRNHSHWLANAQLSSSYAKVPIPGPKLISPPKLSFATMQLQQQPPQQNQHLHQQRPSVSHAPQNFRPVPPVQPSSRFSGPQDINKSLQRDEQKPHPYAIPQALPLRDAPHPYRRDDNIRKSQDGRIDMEMPKKREADTPIENEAKRSARSEEEFLQDSMQQGSVQEVIRQQDDPVQKYIDPECEAKADQLKAELNLKVNQHAVNAHVDFLSANKKAQDSMHKALANRAFDVILSHEIRLLDIRINGIQGRRRKVETNPLRPPVFDSQEARTTWAQGLLTAMHERQKRNEERDAEMQQNLDQSLTAIDAEIEEANRALEEEKVKRREISALRLQQTDSERIKTYLEMTTKLEETMKKLERKPDSSGRRKNSFD